jgi:hypothetical protein
MILGHAFEPVVQAVLRKQSWVLLWYANRTETQIAALAVSMVPMSIK